MSPESIILLLLFLITGGVLSLISAVEKQKRYLRRLDSKVKGLMDAQGVLWPSLSPEVQNLAFDPKKKIAAIKLHRKENPDMSIAEAKAEIDAFFLKRI